MIGPPVLQPFFLLALVGSLIPSSVFAAGHAPYCVLYYKGADKAGDILVNEVCPTVTTTNTYFNCLGWDNGYTGIQDNQNGQRKFIFSVWDQPETKGVPIRSAYSAPNAVVEPFGGEGTGLHYLNATVPWRLNEWVRFVVRRWDAAPVTCFALWTQAEDSGIWTHHITMIYPAPEHMFSSFSYSFLEDWTATGLMRRVQYRNPAERLADKSWYALDHASFSAQNFETAGPYAKAYDAGVAGNAIFIQSGGDTTPTIENSGKIVLPPYAPKPTVSDIQGVTGSAKLNNQTYETDVDWQIPDKSTPQFSYLVEAFGTADYSGPALAQTQAVDSEARHASLTVPQKVNPVYVRLTLTDILDGRCTVPLRKTNPANSDVGK